VQDALERLKAAPYFGSVTVNPVGDDPQFRDLLVEITEGHTASFNIGAGINSNGGVGGNITYRQQNFDITNVPDDLRDSLSEHAFTGAGQQLVASFEPGTIATNASLRFTEPYLFDLPYSFSNEIYLRDRVREFYDDRRLGDRISFGKRFDYTWSAALAFRAELVKIYQIQDEPFRSEQILAAEGSHPLTGLGVNFRRDTTNPGFLPYKGTVTQGAYEYVGALGGEYHFHKLTLNWDGYYTVANDLLDRRTVLGLHGFAGYIPGDAPFFERFYGGGIGSIRGFRFRGVSPRDGRGDDPIGGNFTFTASAELNFPVYTESLRGVIFVDTGDVESEFRIGTIRTSVGAGVRLILPFFGQTPLAIDFAVPINKARGDNSQLISFSLGFTP
jgi:outer membrane protein insertion porin family